MAKRRARTRNKYYKRWLKNIKGKRCHFDGCKKVPTERVQFVMRNVNTYGQIIVESTGVWDYSCKEHSEQKYLMV